MRHKIFLISVLFLFALIVQFFMFYFVAFSSSVFIAIVTNSFSCQTVPTAIGCVIGNSPETAWFVNTMSWLLTMFPVYFLAVRWKLIH